ncbi:MAG: hypothetical protein DI630_11470 [Gordonia sp. (in: high G+C Gram-positive bacteria)]|nr:MAG: hypothetical protein DI630_11470 [Gordonia sp. (in: high G+C Gram-positive bacteria)]
MNRYRVFSLTRITGHVSWWVFVVVTLFAGGITWTGASEYLGPASGTGWSGNRQAYSEIKAPVAIANFTGTSSFDANPWPGSGADPWTQLEVLSVIAFAVVIIAAVIEAVSSRQVVPGIVTVAAPCVAFGLLLLATPGVLDSVRFGTMQTLGVVLVAVAVREVWARRFAPRPEVGASATP